MNIQLKPISDQVVVLLGATSGIGLETAKQFAEQGAKVVIVGRSQEGLADAMHQTREHLAEALGIAPYDDTLAGQMLHPAAVSDPETETAATPQDEASGQVAGYEADVTDFNQIKAVAEKTVERFGRIDTWVNVVGVGEWALFEDTSPEEFRRVIEVNLLGQTYGAMAALPYLKQQNGAALIFVASVAGRIPLPYQSAYTASKHGLLGLIDTLRMELEHTGAPVSVTAILPASLNTPLFGKARTKLGVKPQPVDPIYDVALAARSILHAAAYPVNELIVGDAGYIMTGAHRVAPNLAKHYLRATAFREQRTSIPKSAQAPDNLFEHLPGYNESDGQNQVSSPLALSPITWLSTHPKARKAIYGVLLGVAGALIGTQIAQMIRTEQNRRRSLRYQLPHKAERAYQQVRKNAGKALHQAGKQVKDVDLADLPLVGNLPGIRRPSASARAAETFTGAWATLIALLPFVQRKSRLEKLSDALNEKRDHARRRITKTGEQIAGQVQDTRNDVRKTADQVVDAASQRSKDARKSAEKLLDQANARREDALKAVRRAVPTKAEAREAVSETASAVNQRIRRSG